MEITFDLIFPQEPIFMTQFNCFELILNLSYWEKLNSEH